MVPERFVTEYPSRCMQMFELMEAVARERELVGSFSLVVATSVFMIPYERMKARHPLNRGGEAQELYDAIRDVERERFSKASFWPEAQVHSWRFGRIVNDVNRTEGWQDEQRLHPMAPEAVNTIERCTVNEVLRVVRNALAHGNVIYLDDRGFETKGARVQHLAFLSRYEETKEQRAQTETYRLVATTEEGFLSFVKAWAGWLAALPRDEKILEVAE